VERHSSALAKRYVREIGTDWVMAVTQAKNHRILVAQITPVELFSAIMRQSREKRLSSQDTNIACSLVNLHSNQYYVLALTSAIVARSQTLLTQHPLRAYDAVQLATAIEVNLALITAKNLELTFVSSDQRLLDIAILYNFAIDNPNDH
jgi:predicted nucleic acid-binding protein